MCRACLFESCIIGKAEAVFVCVCVCRAVAPLNVSARESECVEEEGARGRVREENGILSPQFTNMATAGDFHIVPHPQRPNRVLVVRDTSKKCS